MEASRTTWISFYCIDPIYTECRRGSSDPISFDAWSYNIDEGIEKLKKSRWNCIAISATRTLIWSSGIRSSYPVDTLTFVSYAPRVSVQKCVTYAENPFLYILQGHNNLLSRTMHMHMAGTLIDHRYRRDIPATTAAIPRQHHRPTLIGQKE